MISRLKRDILLQLPPKRRHIVNLKITDENLSHHLRSPLHFPSFLLLLFELISGRCCFSAQWFVEVHQILRRAKEISADERTTAKQPLHVILVLILVVFFLCSTFCSDRDRGRDGRTCWCCPASRYNVSRQLCFLFLYLPLLSSLVAPPDPTGARKAVMMQLFTESGMAKIGGILEHLTKFLDDLMSGKVSCCSCPAPS
jgi:hypothetical protein